MKSAILTSAAPAAIGPYSQAVAAGHTVYFSGQLGIDPATGQLADTFEAQARQVFANLRAVAAAAGADMNDFVKLNVYLTDLGQFGVVNDLMASCFSEPYPARAALGVASLPRGAQIEVDGMLVRQP
ncbi:MAG: Rid family detoxifying hydrolase [Burkholderiaceae bacterium]